MFNEVNVRKQREEVKECLERQTKKMKLMSDKSFSEACVRITVCTPLYKVVRGRGDARTVLAVFMKNLKDSFSWEQRMAK